MTLEKGSNSFVYFCPTKNISNLEVDYENIKLLVMRFSDEPRHHIGSPDGKINIAAKYTFGTRHFKISTEFTQFHAPVFINFTCSEVLEVTQVNLLYRNSRGYLGCHKFECNVIG